MNPTDNVTPQVSIQRDRYSILSWSLIEETESTDPGLQIDFPSTEELSSIFRWLEAHIQSRNGYEVEALGHCAKGPQGIQWSLRISFEQVFDRNLLRTEMERAHREPSTGENPSPPSDSRTPVGPRADSPTSPSPSC